MKYPAIMHARIKAPEGSPVLAIKVAETNDFVETPPFPNKVQENLLTYIQTRVQEENAHLMSRLR
jgi:hypothetical protein